jgi:hypothetical protein
MKAYRPSEVVVNNTLFIDKTENAVGINTMTPRYNLDVVGKINCSDVLSVGSNITASGNITATGNLTVSGNVAASGNVSATGNVSASGFISATGNITSSGNVGIGVTSPTNRLNIASDVPYANLTSLTSLRTTAQLHIKQATGTGSLYIANGYTGGVGTGSVIQTSDYYSSADHGTTLFLNPLGGSISFGTNTWHTSSEGALRINFGINSHTYYQTRDKHIFRKATSSTSPYGETDIFTINNDGSVVAIGNVTAFSDARVKTNIVEIDSPLEKIKNMRGVYYNRIDDSNTSPARHVGVIAQEVEAVLPEVVLTDTSEAKNKSVAYGNIVALLIEGMKAQQSTIEGMQAILSSRT